MIGPDVFSVEPWALTETILRPELLARIESLFALSNGHIGLRGNLDEGEPHVVPDQLLGGEPLDLLHEGAPFTLTPGSPHTHRGATSPLTRSRFSRRQAARRIAKVWVLTGMTNSDVYRLGGD
jgi:trehalose/maltose hydrolase-like predicted phosphorylase